MKHFTFYHYPGNRRYRPSTRCTSALPSSCDGHFCTPRSRLCVSGTAHTQLLAHASSVWRQVCFELFLWVSGGCEPSMRCGGHTCKGGCCSMRHAAALLRAMHRGPAHCCEQPWHAGLLWLSVVQSHTSRPHVTESPGFPLEHTLAMRGTPQKNLSRHYCCHDARMGHTLSMLRNVAVLYWKLPCVPIMSRSAYAWNSASHGAGSPRALAVSYRSPSVISA